MSVWWRLGLIAVAVVLAYANSVSIPFVSDDQLTVVENQQIREWWRPAVVLAPERELPVAGRPVVNVSVALNYALGGLDVRGYHAWNIAMHLLCALLAFGVIRRTLELSPAAQSGHAVDVAFASALIWALHPLNTEVVDYITQRTESMMALCYLFTMYASIRALRTPGVLWPALAVVSCALGMGCKESMVTAPVMVVVYDRVMAFDSIRQALRERWRLYAGLAATWLLLAILLWFGPRIHSAGFSIGISPWTYLLNQTVMITEYLKRAIWPRSLVLNYGWPVPLTLGDVLPNACLIVSLFLATIVALVRWPKLGFLGVWFFVALAPTSSIVPIGTEVGAERRMYLPLLALVVLVVSVVFRAGRRGAAQLADRATADDTFASYGRAIVVGVVCLALLAGTMLRNREYSSSLSLARTVLERWPTGIAHEMMGLALIDAGQGAEGEQHLRTALEEVPRAHYDLGVVLFRQGKVEDAIGQLREFVRKQPLDLSVISARLLMGEGLANAQRWPEAIEEYRELQRMRPGNVDVQRLLGDALLGNEEFEEAVAHYQRYLSARPSDVHTRSNMGIALSGAGKADEAVDAFRRAVEIDPTEGLAQRNLGNALYDRRDIAGAEPHARQAVALLPDDPGAHDLLGRVVTLQGRLEEGVSHFERALQLDPNYAEAREHLGRVRAIMPR